MNKQNVLIVVVTLVIGGVLGWWLGGLPADEKAKEENKPLYWVAPMDPSFRRDEPGKSPMGMDLIPVYEEEGDNGGVRVSPTVANNLGIRTASVRRAPLVQDIRTVGYIQFDEDRLHHIHTRVEGWIEKLNISSVGDAVADGDVLFEIYSPELVSAQEEYVVALRSGSRSLLRASRQRLSLLGISDAQITELKQSGKVQRRVSIRAEHGGYISHLKVRHGMFVKPELEVMAIGSLGSVWVVADVLQRQSSALAVGQAVEMTVDALPGQRWQGELDYIYPVLDPASRTVQVRVRFANEGEHLKPNMFADLHISASSEEQVLQVPRAALIRGVDSDRLVKVIGEGRYQSIAVEVGASSDDWIEIRSGLREGDEVVISGQFLIDSESNIEAELMRMSEDVAAVDEDNEEAEPSRVWVEGQLLSINADEHVLNIAHPPIDTWQWPAMTMDFAVDENLDLSALQPNSPIGFCLDKREDGSYLITHIDMGISHEGMNHD